ncbi:MAG: isoleucine--tRNA ligase, partial [Nitriliruptorales bacterium]
IDCVWWALKRLWDDGLIFEDHRVTPYCARCGTALSDAEVALGYRQVEDPSVYVRFPLLDGPLSERQERVSLLVWTTTPWTLPSNVAVAAGHGIDYVLVRPTPEADELLVVAQQRLLPVLSEDAEVVAHITASDLIGAHYQAPFELVSVEGDYRYVTVGDFVTTAEGTGLVHIAPAFGADDMEVGRREGLPVVNPVDLEGRFTTGPWDGTFVKDADTSIIAAMQDAGLVVKAGTYEHTYPFCWRCRTPLIYYAKLSWYIRTTARRDELLAANAKVDWHPEHIREGRFGNWLENNVDWALSRDRYWGTPLPFWRCPAGHVTVVASRTELGLLAGYDLSELDPHRPYVDAITFVCPFGRDSEGPRCDLQAHRVSEVADAWFDSGAMPFAQFGYPHQGQREFSLRFPADFICEAIDQTRGWFYTLLAESTLLFGEPSYRTVLCLGHIVDEQGRKMSKSLGNVLDPWELLDRSGADAMRWLMLTEGSPWLNRRVGPHLLDDIVRRFLLTLWNTHYFFTTYANIDGYRLDTNPPAVSERHVMDRWVLAELADASDDVDRSLERYDMTAAGRRIERFVDDLSNWYVRRARRRFWKAVSEDPVDKAAAYTTLHTCLATLSQLLAPFTPFVSDHIWEDLVVSQDPGAPVSVHLTDFPTPPLEWREEGLREAMTAARRVVELGRQARSSSGVKIRQPLPRALVAVPEHERDGLVALLDEIADELNVKSVELTDHTSDLVERSLRPNFRALGPAFGQLAPTVADALRSLSPDQAAAVADELQEGSATVEGSGRSFVLTPDMVEVVETPRTGWMLAREGSRSFALDVEIPEELRIEGHARELIRAINERRKELGLELDARIVLHLDIEPSALYERLSAAGWFELLAHEVLATEVRRARLPDAVQFRLDDESVASLSLETARW